MKHKHYDLIMAWANGGVQIQELRKWNNTWVDIGVSGAAILWCQNSDYRIKPKEPLVRYAKASCTEYNHRDEYSGEKNEEDTRTHWTIVQTRQDNIKATFDPHTMKLLTVEKI